jgi:arginase family enzyme
MSISISTFSTPGVARANSYAVDGGLSLEDVRYALTEIGAAFTIAGAALTAYDPAADSDGAAAAAIELLRTAAGLADRR